MLPGSDPSSNVVAESAMRKVRWRLIPFLFLLYVIAYLDRVNVGFAAIDMNRDLGFGAAVYGLGSGIFFLSYTLFEVPSNLILARVGVRIWIARIMFTWGVIATAMIFISGPVSFYVLRFLLGIAEAGFFPGLILYLSHCRRSCRARADSARRWWCCCRRSRTSPPRSAWCCSDRDRIVPASGAGMWHPPARSALPDSS